MERAQRFLDKALPLLDYTSHKGSHGRIVVHGGSERFIGAPLYAGTAALRAGADLCTFWGIPSAVSALKAHSAELMYTVDDGSPPVPKLWTPDREPAVCVGPGLEHFDQLRHLIPSKESPLSWQPGQLRQPIVFDAGAAKAAAPQLKESPVESFPFVILTPNVPELQAAAQNCGLSVANRVDTVKELARACRCVVLSKGPEDVIAWHDAKASETLVEEIEFASCPKRCGGQGDVVAGVAACFALYASRAGYDSAFTAAIATSCVVREAAGRAFDAHRRGLHAMQIVEEIAPSIDALLRSSKF